MTAEEFEAGYAARSGITVAQLRAAGRIVVACDCGAEECEGWASVRGDDEQQEEEWSPVMARFALGGGMGEIIRPAPVKIPVMSDAETRTAAVNYIRARYAQNVTWHEVEYDWWRGA